MSIKIRSARGNMEVSMKVKLMMKKKLKLSNLLS